MSTEISPQALAAARKHCRNNMPVDFIGNKRMEAWVDLMAHYAVTAAAPIVAADIAQAIEASALRRPPIGATAADAWTNATERAARIAREAARP